MSQRDEILDLKPQKPGKSGWYTAVFVGSLLLFFYWFIAGITQWPWAGEALILGLAALTVATVIRFVSGQRRMAYEYAYLLGKLCLIVAIYAHLMHWEESYYWLIGAATCFVIGLLVLSIFPLGKKGT